MSKSAAKIIAHRQLMTAPNLEDWRDRLDAFITGNFASKREFAAFIGLSESAISRAMNEQTTSEARLATIEAKLDQQQFLPWIEYRLSQLMESGRADSAQKQRLHGILLTALSSEKWKGPKSRRTHITDDLRGARPTYPAHIIEIDGDGAGSAVPVVFFHELAMVRKNGSHELQATGRTSSIGFKEPYAREILREPDRGFEYQVRGGAAESGRYVGGQAVYIEHTDGMAPKSGDYLVDTGGHADIYRITIDLDTGDAIIYDYLSKKEYRARREESVVVSDVFRVVGRVAAFFVLR